MKDNRPQVEPAAYDAQGRPLYYQPEPAVEKTEGVTSLVTSKPESYEGHNFNPKLRAQHANEPNIVHATRPVEPTVPEVSDEIRQRHEDSVRRYPFLNLSEGEFVILQIKRHPIGLLIPVVSTIFAVTILTSFAFLVPDFYNSMQSDALAEASSTILPESILVAILLLLTLLSVLIGGAAVWVYQRNQFFMTNESVIQEIQHGLFFHHEQTVSLGSIEDASYKRRGIMQHIFNYGTMRLSTEGEETTYRFAFVEDPKRQIATVSNAVEAFKNGRPVRDD